MHNAAEDAVRFETWQAIMALARVAAYDVVPRVLSTPFVATWQDRPAEAERQAAALRGELFAALQAGRLHELVPFTGQSAGLVDEVLPAAEIVRRLVAEAEDVLALSRRYVA